ncbi:hypothetical protein A1O1_05846 [Capronia coronata CBS 617.96]|uniref:Xylanolytic transcriptional activator regulatory domain-containing protein n=1 Tax=Capronia coronata CBS 617.96 TaxID=1182541 RepID=W9XY77_9EURO|nr:uncharacterized protein A1O1_05846 [Capronia coronata CBS 617.96]EXJ85482.1 hypothetical protein A1O1_05846 [Capronia coronata CBS 617.96]
MKPWQAFQYHDSNAPPNSQTSAFSATKWKNADGLTSSRPGKQPRQKAKPSRASTPSTLEFLSLLPDEEPATLILDTYFDRVHWFTLIFHQGDFRDKFGRLYAGRNEPRAGKPAESFGFVSTLLAAFVIALQHSGVYRKELLRQYGVEADSLKKRMLSSLRTRLLDILSLGSMEAVQTCVLLGSYYLYQGQPELAWPICGCGLRIAQALHLYRKMAMDTHPSSSRASVAHYAESRKRTWWAVYEIETICSMLYGYPLSISDNDCDIEYLDPHANQSIHGRLADHHQPPSSTGAATLLSYKAHMSKLSVIIRTALTDIYGGGGQHSGVPATSIGNRTSRLQQLALKVAELDDRLRKWQEELPHRLRFEDVAQVTRSNYLQVGEIDSDIGASGEKFENHIFQLQALALKLAYENARILVHRPLLSYKITTPSIPPEESGRSLEGPQPFSQETDPFSHSVRVCRDAALQTSRVGSHLAFSWVSISYAAAFSSMHLFTAGVTLCIMTSLEPLSLQAHESKIGIHRLMAMQLSLKETSIMAAQGLAILQQLAGLTLQKEMNQMFNLENPKPPCPQRPSSEEQRQASHSSQRYEVLSENANPGAWFGNAHSDVNSFPPVLESSPSQAEQNEIELFEGEGSQLSHHAVPLTFDADVDENPDVARTLLDLEHGRFNGFLLHISDLVVF